MAFTKTVNYTQNIPVALGYLNEVSGTAGVVRVTIKFNAKAGRLNVETLGGISSSLGGDGCSLGSASEWVVEGTEAEVNAILNKLKWYPAAYDDANIEQDFLSEDRAINEYKGEVLIETEDRDSLATFSLQDTFKLDNAGVVSSYTISELETTRSNYRIYGTLNGGYKTALQYGPDYTNIPIYTTTLLDDSDTLIDNITDYAIVNPHGQYFLNVTVTDDQVPHDSGVTTLDGELFVKEPEFSVFPPTTHVGNGPDTWTSIQMGEVTQPDNERVSVQILIKRLFNDPLFDGDVAINKPSYVEDETYACFNETRIDDRISESYEDGVVRWSFYGTPDQCTRALQGLKVYTPPTPRDFVMETRIVNGRARISHDRGYD